MGSMLDSKGTTLICPIAAIRHDGDVGIELGVQDLRTNYGDGERSRWIPSHVDLPFHWNIYSLYRAQFMVLIDEDILKI